MLARPVPWHPGFVRRRALRLLSLVVTLSAVPIALLGIPTIRCPTRTGTCHAVSYPRLGVMVLLVVLGVLLWGITEAGEGDGAAGGRPPRARSDDPP